MGAGEESTPAKPCKPTVSTLVTPTMPSYLDGPTRMQVYDSQAFYGGGATPPPFFTSTVSSSPTPHPYLWGSQHPLMPPYGSPFPHPTLYPHGGISAHPNTTLGTALLNTEAEGKSPSGKDRASVKKSKGSSGNTGLVDGKSGASGKAASSSGDDGASQSAESGSEGSSDASYKNTNHQDSSATNKRSFKQMLADGENAKINTDAPYCGANLPVSVPVMPVVPTPVTNLNIRMDLWTASPAGAVPMKARKNASGVSPAVTPATMVGCEGLPHNQWIQDKHELKLQRRKQSNRESARRSRLRKQAEIDKLQAQVETVNNESCTLRDEMQRLNEECEKLTSENTSIMEELTRLYGPDAITALKGKSPTPVLQSANGECNSHGHDASRNNN